MKKYCRNCGAEMDDSATFCESCGTKSGVSADNGKDWVKATAEEPMTHCEKCKRQVPLYGDEKCPYCGAVVHEPTGPVCPKCGTQMQDEARKCVVCGADIPAENEEKTTTSFLKLLVIKDYRGLYKLSIVGWIVLAAIALLVMGLIWLITLLTA